MQGKQTAGPRPIYDAQNGGTATRPPAHRKEVLAEQIREGWTETFERIVETGEWLIEGRFRKAEFACFELPISYSYGRKLIRVCRSPKIRDPANRCLLPDRADTLHQISLLTDRMFDLAVTEGVINRNALSADILQFRRSFMEPGQSRRRRMTVVIECSPDREQSAMDTLGSFVEAVQRVAESRFPSISIRGPRKMKEFAAS